MKHLLAAAIIEASVLLGRGKNRLMVAASPMGCKSLRPFARAEWPALPTLETWAPVAEPDLLIAHRASRSQSCVCHDRASECFVQCAHRAMLKVRGYVD